MSLNITGNSVRVKGFSTVQGAEIGPAQACGQIQASENASAWACRATTR